MGHCSLASLKVKLSQRAGGLNDSYRSLGKQAWAGEIAQWVEALAAKPVGLSSNPWPHTVERENCEPNKLSLSASVNNSCVCYKDAKVNNLQKSEVTFLQGTH
jgi:hypothetical protein